MTDCVLDASALVALLRNEPGAQHVAGRLLGSAISVVNLCEVVALFARNGAAPSAIHAVIDPLPIARVAMDEALAYEAGIMQPLTRSLGLSLGDRVCLALGKHLSVPVLTADRAWQALAKTVGVQVVPIR